MKDCGDEIFKKRNQVLILKTKKYRGNDASSFCRIIRWCWLIFAGHDFNDQWVKGAALHSSRRVSVPPGGTLSVTGEYVTSAVRSIGIACSRFSLGAVDLL
jgi:hypothetical protein